MVSSFDFFQLTEGPFNKLHMKLPLVLDPLFISEPIFKIFVALFKTFGLQKDDTGYISLGCFRKDRF